MIETCNRFPKNSAALHLRDVLVTSEALWRESIEIGPETKNFMLHRLVRGISRIVAKNQRIAMKQLALNCTIFLITATFAGSTAWCDEKNNSEYIRITRTENSKKTKSLDTAVVRYEGEPRIDKKKREQSVQVDLIAAVHLGDKRYYEDLNERFKQYDVVLYELVIPEGVEPNEELFARRKEQKEEDNLLSAIQNGLSDSLGLAHQLKVVDYTAKNFVHADMTAEEFFKRVAERGDLAGVFSRAMLHSASDEAVSQSGRVEGRLFGALFSKNKTLTMKRIFADEMVNQMDASMWIISGSEGSAIISDRNAIALKRLREQILDEKGKIAIFYGAAHLKEFAKSLQTDFRLKKTKTEWIEAWDLTK